MIEFIYRLLGKRNPRTSGRRVPIAKALDGLPPLDHPYFNHSTKPYARWWWLTGPFLESDIAAQLDWVRDNGFGGVEIAWIAPTWLYEPATPPKWLSDEWSEIVALASRLARERGLGCDFTFGSSWPFGGSFVSEEDASQTFNGPSSERLHGSWEHYDFCECRVLNHLSSDALRRYSTVLLSALRPAIQPGTTALFCDSLEVETRKLWDGRLWDRFEERFGYRLEPFVEALDSHVDVRYDYRKLIAETMCKEFYATFSEIAHGAGVVSRVQCHGSPTDLLTAYGSVDIPESETLLFEPHFSRIPASAAALSNKTVVSAETFTCIYGFSYFQDPELYRLWKNEDILDLKLLADAIIANGVNQIVWHGMPYNPPNGSAEFYAPVHVGPNSGFAESLARFNGYLENICRIMQEGKTSQVAVYLPNEDSWMAGRIPEEERTPGASYRWQMRHVVVPREAEGYHPLWVSCSCLEGSVVENGALLIGDTAFQSLYVDSDWLDYEALAHIVRIARAGVPVVMKRRPKEPGHCPHSNYESSLDELLGLASVFSSLQDAGITPFVSGSALPFYWARRADDAIYGFLSHPATRDIHYPMRHRQSRFARRRRMQLRFSWNNHSRTLPIVFPAQSSVLLKLNEGGAIDFIESEFTP